MPNKNLHVVVAGFDGAVASAITGIVDLLSLAGVSWNRIHQQDIQRLFRLSIASPQAQPIRCINGLCLQAQLSYQQLQDVDVLIIPTIGGPVEDVLKQNPLLVGLIQNMYQNGVTIAGNCTGSFFLAESGILDGRVATTHWGFEQQFRLRYPQVKLHAEQMISRDGQIYTAGGGLAWFDLGLHFIEHFYGYQIALETAKSFVLDYQRHSHVSYALFRIAKPHQDVLVEQIQRLFAEDLSNNMTLEEIAARVNLTTRTLIRRFKAALDLPPQRYLQAMRIEAAQKCLEQTEQSIDQVMESVGYHDSSAFRRAFQKHTGFSPYAYRRRFKR